MSDKEIIESWLKLYNILNKTGFRVIGWPDRQDRTRKAIDALCEDGFGHRLAVEHALIQPFEGEKADRARFIQALAALEGDPRLILPGFAISVTQPVGCVQKGVQRANLSTLIRDKLARDLPNLPVGQSKISVPVDSISISLRVYKDPNLQYEPASFTTSRIWPGDPGPDLILAALRAKIPKLATHEDATRILLF
jgi:hypothetical protein